MKILQLLLTGHTFSSVHVVEHPAFMAAWWGFFVTAINLIPAGQLDGGHTLYAVFGRRHRLFRWPVLVALVGLGFLYTGLVGLGRNRPRPDGICAIRPSSTKTRPSIRSGGRSPRPSC